jgi:hypothetical protein
MMLILNGVDQAPPLICILFAGSGGGDFPARNQISIPWLSNLFPSTHYIVSAEPAHLLLSGLDLLISYIVLREQNELIPICFLDRWHVVLDVSCCRTSVLGPYQPRMESVQQGQTAVSCEPGAQQAAVRPQSQVAAHRQTQGKLFILIREFELHTILTSI